MNVRWWKPKHKHAPVESHTTNLGYFKETCGCGAYRCRELLGEMWIERRP